MKSIDNNREFEYLSGLIERVTFHNEENGFCVLRVKVKGNRDLVTIVGNSPSISPGEQIECKGRWHNDKNHGLQFKADFLESSVPNTLDGMEKYLASGLVKGVGPYFAKKMVKEFGLNVFEIIEKYPSKLTIIEGVGKKRAAYISHNWDEQKTVRDIMVFLQSHGVGTARATKIYKTYGDNAIKIVSENPYRLSKDIRGIGFISADIIAQNLGIAKNSLIRARAGISYVLLEATSEGHCGLPEEELLKKAVKLLEIDEFIIQQAINLELEVESVVKDKIGDIDVIFIAAYYAYEKAIAQKLKDLAARPVIIKDINIDKATRWVEEKSEINLAENQKLAIKTALTSKVSVITGGPGTGKTTIVNSILKIIHAKKLDIKLCAPTGRAAKRLAESTSMEAKTIHRMLEIDPVSGAFKRDEEKPLEVDLLVIDECSMVDVSLFYSLIRAVPKHAMMLIVGDVDQLPSVGAGKVLSDIIDSSVIKVARLTEIFRQAKTSDIVTNAHRINKGLLPNFELTKSKTDFYFIEAEPGNIVDKIIKIVKERIPNKFGFNSLHDIQILSPMRRGGVGTQSLNIELQKALNPNYKNAVEKFGQYFAIGDKVMQIVNDYDKDVYNGDIGYIRYNDRHEQELTVLFDGNEVVYDYADLDQLIHAYATTIHKSQGSEYPVVIIPLTMQSFMMLKRNLIYTGITRGKQLVIIVGQKKAVAMAVKNTSGMNRYCKLKEWLIGIDQKSF